MMKWNFRPGIAKSNVFYYFFTCLIGNIQILWHDASCFELSYQLLHVTFIVMAIKCPVSINKYIDKW